MTSAVAALLGLAGETATGDAGWFSAVCLGAAAAFVGVIANHRGYRAARSVGFAALTAVTTMVLWLPAILALMLAWAVAAPFDDTGGEPWSDYLAIPIAPLILLLQLASIFLSNRTLRWAIGFGCTATLTAMFLYVASIDLAPEEGANIGAGVMLLWILCSIGLLAATGIGEALKAVGRRLARPRARGTG